MDGVGLFFLFFFFMVGFLIGYGVLRSSGANYRGGGVGARICVVFLAAVSGGMALAEKSAYDHASHEMYGGMFHLLAAPALAAMGAGLFVSVLTSFGSPPTSG